MFSPWGANRLNATLDILNPGNDKYFNLETNVGGDGRRALMTRGHC
jgi:hypothetical protein